MPTRVQYDSKRIIPAPTVQVSKSYQKSADEELLGSAFNLTITGTQLAYKGSPLSDGSWYTGSSYPLDETVVDTARLAAIIRKQEAIRQLFSQEGKSLEFQSADGSQPMKCNPKLVGLEFQNDIWYQSFNYTINLEADIIYVNGIGLGGSGILGEDGFANFISEAAETWTFDTDEDRPETLGVPRTYRVSHSVSAKGKRFYDENGILVKAAWKQAQNYALPKLGFDATIALSSGVNNLPSYYSAYNHIRNEQIDEQGGSYSVTETFVLSSGSAIEEFNVSTRTSLDNGLTNVTIEGTVIGLEIRNASYVVTSSKYTNAVNKFGDVQNLLLFRAQTYSGATLNISPISTVVGRNPLTGIINYNYEYNDRPSNVITGAKSEVISVNDNWGIDVFAPIFVLGRTIGPVIQNLGTKKERTRNLSIELVMPIASGNITNRFYTNKPSVIPATQAQIQSIVDAINPATFGATNVNVSEQTQSWDGSRYSLNIGWAFELNQNTII